MQPFRTQLVFPFWRCLLSLAIFALTAHCSLGEVTELVFLQHQTSASKMYANFDVGTLPPQTKLRRMRIVLAQNVYKRDALQTLLAEQQDRHSARYHEWISAQQYGQRFGADPHTVATVSQWLVSSGMSDLAIPSGKSYIAFSGSVENVERAMHVALHAYRISGEMHYANTLPPRLPKNLQGLVSLIQGLDDFIPRPPHHAPMKAQYVSGSGVQSLGPGDLAKIYDIQPLYRAGITGARSKIAIVGAAAPSLNDFRAYKQLFGLPTNDFSTVTVPGSATNESTGGAVIEAALDLEVAGGIAPQAKLVYVQDDDILGAVAYVIDNQLADVVSMSYTACELPGPEDLAYETLALQGMAEGITWVNASGDSGAAACDQAGSGAAISGLAVNLPASLPEVTGVGGTAFVAGSPGQYWGTSNSAGGATVRGYVPEIAWNASGDGQSVTAGGGGVSKDFYKPGYQSSIDDGKLYREVPDISFDASEANPPYLIVTGGQTYYVGGTSAATPLFASIAALINDSLLASNALKQSGLGSVNAKLYRLAQTDPDDFHDVTSGNNKVGCAEGSIDCTEGLLGYDAAPGYDMATGLGSIDVYKLSSDWESADLGSTTVRLAAAFSENDGPVTLTATVTAETNPAPGTLVFSWTNASYLNVPMEFARVAAGEDGVATTTFAGLPSGINLVSVAFQGTTALLGSVSSAITVNVNSARGASATVAMLDVQAQVSASDYLPLSATVSGTGPAPGGVVNFYLGTTLMGSASVVQGVAMTLSSALPPPGAGLLTAHYSGDANYDAAVSTPISIDVVASAVSPPPPAAVPDFTLTAPSTITMAQGDNSNILLTITPLNGFASAIQFACTGAVSGYSCTAPASVTPRASLTVSAILAAQAAAFLPFSAVLLLRKRRRVLFTGGLLLALSGCGYHVNQPGQAVTAAKDSGNYSVTITATSGTLIHTAVVTVIVQ